MPKKQAAVPGRISRADGLTGARIASGRRAAAQSAAHRFSWSYVERRAMWSNRDAPPRRHGHITSRLGPGP